MFRKCSGFLLLTLCLLVAQPAWSVLVSSVGTLETAVNNANSGGDMTILLADGVYDLTGVALHITADGVTVRSASGNREAVVLDNHYVAGGTSGIFRVVSSGVTIADMTLKRPYYHAIHISPGEERSTENILIDNVHIVDPGEQAIKINADATDSATYTVNNSTIRECLIELTDVGRASLTSDYPCYTGGIDAHWAANWTVRDNVIKGFWCSDGLSEHGIHFWNNSSNILVERNRIIDCDRGIGFGLGSDGNNGGIIRNNMVFHGPDHGYGYCDVGISVESTPNAEVYNNTIYHGHDYSAIEYRFSTTTGILIVNNLTNRAVSQRDGASGQVENNLTKADSSWFTNTVAGDLHLAGEIYDVIDRGLPIAGLTDDFDGDSRPQGRGYDLGADEIGGPSPPTTSSVNLSWLMLLLNKE